MKGVDIRTVQELLGDADIRMTLRYSHLSPAQLLDAVELLSPERTGPTTGTSDSSTKSVDGEPPLRRRLRGINLEHPPESNR